eukprot:431290-Pleurochrysis_carterae.AAC.2
MPNHADQMSHDAARTPAELRRCRRQPPTAAADAKRAAATASEATSCDAGLTSPLVLAARKHYESAARVVPALRWKYRGREYVPEGAVARVKGEVEVARVHARR